MCGVKCQDSGYSGEEGGIVTERDLWGSFWGLGFCILIQMLVVFTL